jgi:hypothetical protein
MEINTHWVAFKGKFELPEPLDREKYLIASGEWEHLSYQEKPNGDGTADAIYSVAPVRVMVQAGDRKLVGKVKKRSSQRLRAALWHEFQTTGLDESLFEDWYDERMNKFITHLPELLNFIK